MTYRAHDARRKFGVEAGPYTGDRVVDLAKLPRGVRDALRERLEATAPILTATRSLDRFAYGVLVLLGAGGAFALSGHGFGELDGPTQLEAQWSLAYVALGVVAFAGLGLLVRSLRREGVDRFPQGTLVYPLDLLVIEGRRMRVRSFGDVRHAEGKGGVLEFEYANGDKLRVRGRRHTGASLLAELLTAQHDLEDATAAQKSTKDVLGVLRDQFTWAELAPPASPPRSEWPVAIALTALGAVVGFAGWSIRKGVEDDALFDRARSINRVAAYRSYQAVGKRHWAEARDDEADAARAMARGNVKQLADVVATYSGTSGATKALQELRDACGLYARDVARDRCESSAANADGSMPPCVARAEESLCSPEIESADRDHVLHSSSLEEIFVEQRRAQSEGRTAAVADFDARIDTLIQEANANICAVDAPNEDLRALHSIARSFKRVALLSIRVEGDTIPRLEVFLRSFARDPVTVNWAQSRALSAQPDLIWTFRRDGAKVEWESSRPGQPPRVAKATLVTDPTINDVASDVVHALEELGFRPRGPGPARCVIPVVRTAPQRGTVVVPRMVPTDG